MRLIGAPCDLLQAGFSRERLVRLPGSPPVDRERSPYRRNVRHATPSALDELEPLLVRIREFDGLVERKRGVFYRRSKAFLHFHEDAAGLHADVRLSADFERIRVQSAKEQDDLLAAITLALPRVIT